MRKITWIIFIFLFLENVLLFSQESAYKFTPGYYYILDYSINFRSQPNLRGEIIGKLKLNDKIEILENTNIIQNIDDISAYWYKIKFNEIIGYIFGGYIAVNRIVIDIDQNGMDDYFYFRFSKIKYEENGIGFVNILDSYSDIIIYINNEKISTKNIYRDLPENHYWMWCELNTYNDSKSRTIFIKLVYHKGTGFPDEIYDFRINGNKNIIFNNKYSFSGISPE